MAGQAKTKAFLAEIASRAADEDCTCFEYVERWLESGGSLVSLAQHIADTTDLPVMRATLTRRLEDFAATDGIPLAAIEQRLTRARTIGAMAKVEQAEQIADTATVENVQLARLQVHTRHWSAERFNREQFGQNKGVNVSISVGGLHLEALKAMTQRPAITAQEVTGSYVIEGEGVNTARGLLPQTVE